MANIKSLLNKLNTLTHQCNILNESTDEISEKIKKIRLILSNFGNFSEIKITEDLDDKIMEASKIKITNDFRISTYPNIHNTIKFDVKAGAAMDYIINKINESIDNKDTDFDSDEIVEEAIAFAFKTCTNKNLKKRMTLTEFKDSYRLVALGSQTRSGYIKPNIYVLAKLCRRTPFIITYIDHNLIHNHINYLYSYLDKLRNDFSKLIKNDESLEPMINKYLSCFKKGVETTLSMYKYIRYTFVELFTEYKRIFNEVISIDKIIQNNLDESVMLFNNTAKKLNTIINPKNSNILNESIEENKKESLESLKNHLNTFINNYECIRNKYSDILYSKLIPSLSSLSNIDNDKIIQIKYSKYNINNNLKDVFTDKFVNEINNIDSKDVFGSNIGKDNVLIDLGFNKYTNTNLNIFKLIENDILGNEISEYVEIPLEKIISNIQFGIDVLLKIDTKLITFLNKIKDIISDSDISDDKLKNICYFIRYYLILYVSILIKIYECLLKYISYNIEISE